METIYGIMEYKLRNKGSKSQGMAAILKTKDGKEYLLYRADYLPYNDSFFSAFNGKEIGVNGTAEDVTGFFCVNSILSEDGTEIVPDGNIMDLFTMDNPIIVKSRIPRKLKKQLKKNKL